MHHKTRNKILFLWLLAMFIGCTAYVANTGDIAIHWDANGMADTYAPRYVLFLLPMMIPLFDWLLLGCRKLDPKRANYAKFADSFDTLRFLIAMIMFCTYLMTAAEAWQSGMLQIQRISLLLLGTMVCVCGNIMPRFRPNYFIGIRNPWTLHNEQVWCSTHRISGWLWFFGGIMICLSACLSNGIPFLILIILLIIALPNLYAYYSYKGQTST